MTRSAFLITILVAGLLLIGLAVPALAGGDDSRGDGGRDHDHDRAREAVLKQDARPLVSILPEVERRYRARMVEVDFESEDGRLVYKIKLLTRTGRIIEVEVDAATGDIVKDDLDDDHGHHSED